MEVVVRVPVDFNFDSACSSPYITAPSSPQRFGRSFFFSAPTSPTRASAAVPFQWEEKPGIPKTKGFHGRRDEEDDENFEFDFSGQLESTSLSAEELFEGGKVRPLNHFDPFETAIDKSRKGSVRPVEPKQQGRDRSTACSSSSSSSSNKYNYVHKKSRSFSPFRISHDATFEQETISNPKSYVSSILSSISFSKGNWKWRLKDLLLLRSALEGRATSNGSFRKYDVLSKKDAEDVNNLSFRSMESVGSSSRRRGRVSAHELHYTANRAMSEEMRRKTFLPYRQGLLGCLGFNPRIHEFSRGIVSLKRG
ncbi:Serine carboxypeptidase-like 26 [Hibiscus syriacus]|uniref:Serine carboxypeptidase-like 26 n=1 Tax=Hibiscus syriacus TaxID=106335 RepID=A0A6A2Y4N6_HIBSY|nr:uncharacterized protein LOC120179316 [Hibiscus syriacus]KAE8667429.1 Serine carboxypeptidase-like 26 [Hibiscus syriacus]